MKPNKFLKNRSGIYGIRNIVNGKIYVGQTKCMYHRCHQYVYDFENRSIGHLNDYLYNAMRKIGIVNFEFFPLEFCSISQLQERELHWILKFGSLDRMNGYNLRSDTATGMKVSECTSAKISENLKNQWANGIRDGHSAKLKSRWKSDPNRRNRQAAIFSRLRTKFEYTVTNEDGVTKRVLYSELKAMGLKNVIANFHREGSDNVTHKGFQIKRFSRGET